ncbi:MAG: 16S rRNA (cytosine(1402)-N(4))-methyltransferase RsmH [Nitrospinae bacterium]|nr:16S rRNA (cytosine(1402)-N(4))-methyltransferase RsmH [Nitrospinota bacterium]
MKHVPVLLEEVVSFLFGRGESVVVDATLGGGGHAEAVLRRFPEVKLLIGLDRDEEAVERAAARLAPFGPRVRAQKAHFIELGDVMDRMGVSKADAVLMDLGVSSFHLDDPARGFSFSKNGPLDMRMDKAQSLTAAGLVNTLGERELALIFYRYGEERHSARIAKEIVKERAGEPIATTGRLAKIVEKAMPGGAKHGPIHPATRVFQALRIAVNGELDNLAQSIEKAAERLNPGGRIGVISFHSLEDRIVKDVFSRLSGRCECPPGLPVCVCGKRKSVNVITRKPVTAGDEETGANPRARSAKLRVAERVEEKEAA